MSKQLGGLNAWLIQRASAVYIAVFILCWGFATLLWDYAGSYRQWHALWSSPFVNLATLLFFVALLLHAWVGIRDVILDYIKPFAIRLSALMLLATALIICGLWVLRVLFNAL
ncbi:MAG: succinate dehydrogenase, hydrophobic membrane anchor protein [Gammaproteobacteria bacterium]